MAVDVRKGLAMLAAILALAGCASRDAHVPDFARQPFEPFSREAVVAIALREWRTFGSRVVEVAPSDEALSAQTVADERRQGLWQRIGEYWWLGLNSGATGQAYTGLHDEAGRRFAPSRDGAYAWSAAFVSYVMRVAGAGDRFPYAAAHAIYINAAAREETDGMRLEDPRLYAPQLGDLVCIARGDGALSFADLPAARFSSHCDIVVGRFETTVAVVGGNVDDSVALKYLPIDADGRLRPQGRPWLAVLRVVYGGA